MNTSLPWKFDVVRRLGEPGAPRVFTRAEFQQWIEESTPTPPPSRTLFRALKELEGSGLVQRSTRGIYLNRQAHPLPTPAEAAVRIRPGAIVSLSTVLGGAGVINNPTHWITAVVPVSRGTGAGEVESETGSLFRFARMRDDLLPSDHDDWGGDALAPYAPVPTATPEKALLDWVYMATSPRGAARWPLPPAHDWDLSYLDAARLDRLATRMGLEAELARFREDLEGPGPRVSFRRGPR